MTILAYLLKAAINPQIKNSGLPHQQIMYRFCSCLFQEQRVFGQAVPGSWKGTRTKFLMGLVLRLRVFSRIREAPSITCFRSSYMEPVTSNTKARVEALSPDPSSSSARGIAKSLCALIQSANTKHFNKTRDIFFFFRFTASICWNEANQI